MNMGLKLTVTAAVIFAATAGAASAECLKVSGLGTGLTPDIAQFMANKALKDSIANRGLKSAGKSSMSCNSSMVVVTNCTAAQRACK
jgi:hypothetical protein